MPITPYCPSKTEQALLAQLCVLSEEAIFILDANLVYQYINKSFVELTGYDNDSMLGNTIGKTQKTFIPKTTLKLVSKALHRLAPNQVFHKDLLVMSSYGIKVPLHISIWRVVHDDNDYYLGLMHDQSYVRRDKKQIQQLQNFNQVTKLPNRQFFMQKLGKMLLETKQQLAVVRISLDNYRMLLTSLALDKTNQLLCQFADRLNNSRLKNLSCFAHFDSEEFAMIFELEDADMVRNELDKILQLCELPFSINHHTLYIHISIGVSYYTKDGEQMDVLINKAEKALEHIKKQGGDGVFCYTKELQYSNLQDIELEAELRRAFDESQFVAYYQPKVTLTNGDIVGFEALVRWQHPTKGLLTPQDFLSAIITHRLSFELFFMMAEKSVQLLNHWQKLGLDAHLCLNADAAEFSNPNFVGFLQDLLLEHDITSSNIHVEVTESSLMLQQKNVTAQLQALKQLGVCLALDDFGTGYASLSYLQEYPFDFIKVDKSFVSDITNNPKQLHIVEAIITLGDALGMKIVGEGIEDIMQKQLLKNIGCHYGQGYLFGKPMSSEQATQLLQLQQHQR